MFIRIIKICGNYSVQFCLEVIFRFCSRSRSICRHAHKLYRRRRLGTDIALLGFLGIQSCRSVRRSGCPNEQDFCRASRCIGTGFNFMLGEFFAAPFDVAVFGSGHATCAVRYFAPNPWHPCEKAM